MDQFCDGPTLVRCDRGFAMSRQSCAGACGVFNNDLACFPEFACEVDIDLPPTHCFNRAWLVTCDGKELVDAQPCELGCVSGFDTPSTCARAEDAEPGCAPGVYFFCNGNELVGCDSGFAVERLDCASRGPGRVCRSLENWAQCEDASL